MTAAMVLAGLEPIATAINWFGSRLPSEPTIGGQRPASQRILLAEHLADWTKSQLNPRTDRCLRSAVGRQSNFAISTNISTVRKKECETSFFSFLLRPTF